MPAREVREPYRTGARTRYNFGATLPDFIPVPNTAHLTLGYQDDVGREFSNSLDMRADNPWDIETLITLANTAADAWAENLQGMFNESIKLLTVKAVSLEAEDAPGTIITPSTDNVGTRAGQSMALHTAMSITFRTDLRGRSFRGRLYHTGLSLVDLQTNARWEPTVASEVGTAYSAFANALEIGTASDHVVVSRQQDHSHLLIGETTLVTGYVGRTPIATMRLRVSP